MDLTIAIGDDLSPQAHSGSPRMGSVWNRDGQRKSPDTASVMRKSLGSGLPTPTEVNKRRAAADFIKQCTGLDVPYSNDLSFRQALGNGVVLCETLNKVVPNAVKIDSSADGGESNVRSFLTYIGETMRFPSEARFSVQDLLSEDFDDRPRIVDCLLHLRKIHSGQELSSSPIAFMLRESNDLQTMRDSPRKGQGGIDLVAALSQQHQKQQQAQMSMVLPTGPRTIASMQPTANLALLYNDISKSLMQRMTPGMAPGMQSSKYDAIVSNVMEQFLNGLTVEYERRLLAKDQELNASKDALTRLTKQMEMMQAQLDSISGELEEQKRAEVDRLTQASQQRLQEQDELIADLQQRLLQRTEELESAEAALGSHDGQLKEQVAALEAQLAEACSELDTLASLKQRYNALREENKKLYNTVQDLKGSIRVFCRVRPAGTTGDPSPSCLDVGTEGELAVYDKAGERKVFKFDRVFAGESTQEVVYEDVQTLIRSVMDGYNVCIFAYGQTGSGKTHTMTGSHVDDERGRGINYRALDDLFSLQAQREGDMSYVIQAQMLEIYNETIRDLLAEDQGSANKLEILSTMPSGQNVRNATQIPVGNTADVLTMMTVGARNRHSAETKMNERSSRSHQVLTIIVDGQNLTTGARTHACLHLVDLAGSERTDKSGVEGERLREANSINTSLSALGTVMHSLASKSKHIPFRNSKLTELLADSLSGQAKVCMLMHVAPESSSHGESISTLNFGNRVASVTLGQAKCNIESGKVFEAHEALAKKDKVIADLREQLQASHKQLLEQAALMQSLRSQLAMLQGDVGMQLSARSDSMRTVNVHTPDSASTTPVSAARPNRPVTTTPRSQGALLQSTEHLHVPSSSQTPRAAPQRSPAPLALAGVPRSATNGTPRASGTPSAAHSAEGPSAAAATSSELDRPGSLNSARGNRGQQQSGTSSMGVVAVSKSSGASAGRQLPPPIPRLDTLSAAKIGGTHASGSMSARPSNRNTFGTSGNAATAAPRRSAGSAVSLNRPATSRAGSVYGSTGSLSSTLSMTTSVMLTESPTARGNKPPLSSRPSGGWK